MLGRKEFTLICVNFRYIELFKVKKQKKFSFLFIIVIFFLFLLTRQSFSKEIKKTYLLYVSFYTPSYNELQISELQALNDSPYNGMACPLIRAYSDIQVSVNKYKNKISFIKKYSHKHIWPWIFLNRIVGYDPNYSKKCPAAKKQYFRRIKGMDIFDKSSALSDFFNIWKTALIVAKETGTPGIVVDLEPYNNHMVYNVSYLMHRMYIPRSKVISELEKIGKQLANLTNEIYPDAVIWCLFTGLSSPIHYWRIFHFTYYRSVTYIIIGLLKQAKLAGYKFKVVSGGEISLGYCFKSLNDLKQKIKFRREKFSSLLFQYPNLFLGGTIAPWEDIQSKHKWLLRGTCGCSDIKNINEFLPLFCELFRTYKYVWIYAAWAAGYNLFDEVGRIFNQVIKRALEENKH